MEELGIAPGRCAIGWGAVEDAGRFVSEFGRRALILGGRSSLEAVSRRLTRSLDSHAIDYVVVPFRGECSDDAIAEVSSLLSVGDVVVAVGGGRVIDTGKAAARRARAPVVTIPTSAATCAAATSLSIMHTPAGVYQSGRFLPPAPESLIVDLAVIQEAPPRLLAAGLADALARTRETALASRVALPTLASVLSQGSAQAYWGRVLATESAAALHALGSRNRSPALARVVAACIVGAGVSSGLCGGFFSLGVAHSIAYALTHLLHPDQALHGEVVGVGLLAQSTLEDASGQAWEETDAWLHSWGLPRSLTALGLPDTGSDTLDSLARQALRYLDLRHAVPFPVDALVMRDALARIA